MRHDRLTAGRVASLLSLAALAPVVASCLGQDPVHDALVATLGSEIPGRPVGEYHRAGQPCTVCHGGEGPASTVFSIAGTVFDGQDSVVGANGAEILLVDALGSSPPTVKTNCVGNFFITPDQWAPAFPVLVGIHSGSASTVMASQISRATSCAQCHYDPPGAAAVGHVYIDVSPNPNEEKKCPVSPNAAVNTQ